MKDILRHKDKQHLIYDLNKWDKKGTFDILNEISKNVTLVNLIYTLGNVNHDFSIVGYWIFDSTYEKSLHLTR